MDFFSENFKLLLSVATVFTVVLNMFNWWFISKGKMATAYVFSMFVYMGYICIETTLALRDPDQASILLFNIINFWALAMSIKGHLRLKSVNESVLIVKN